MSKFITDLKGNKVHVGSPVTCKKPKLTHFKIGKLGDKRQAKRLQTATNQLVKVDGKEYNLTVNYVTTHNDGTITGYVKLNQRTVHVSLIRKEVLKERNTIRGTILVPIRIKSFWDEIKAA